GGRLGLPGSPDPRRRRRLPEPRGRPLRGRFRRANFNPGRCNPMKFIVLIGGASGFVTAAVTDFAAGRSADRIFFDGALGCFAGGLLFRWFWNVLLRGIRDTYVARH